MLIEYTTIGYNDPRPGSSASILCQFVVQDSHCMNEYRYFNHIASCRSNVQVQEGKRAKRVSRRRGELLSNAGSLTRVTVTQRIVSMLINLLVWGGQRWGDGCESWSRSASPHPMFIIKRGAVLGRKENRRSKQVGGFSFRKHLRKY